MGLLSPFKRNDEPSVETPSTPDAVTQARAQARRRLIGAALLLAVGVIGFPLLFETQPRPVRMDIPIEIPRKEGAPPLVMPPVVAPPPAEPAARASSAIATERADEQGREVAPAAAKTSTAASRPAAPANAAASAAPGVAPGASPRAAAGADDGARAKAILEGQPVPAAAASATAIRIVVQVGAYTDVDKLREARAKVEQLGFKTYTQVVETDGAQRTRVRVGPFASKAEADKAAAKIKAAGLPVALLTL